MKIKYTKVTERLEGPYFLARLESGKVVQRKVESLIRQNTNHIIWSKGIGNALVMSSNTIEKLLFGSSS